MSLRDSVRHALASLSPAGETCRACSHFRTAPAEIETHLPGLAILSSADASIRAYDGLCLAHDRLTNGVRRCSSFSGR